jgi:hypothetical protein
MYIYTTNLNFIKEVFKMKNQILPYDVYKNDSLYGTTRVYGKEQEKRAIKWGKRGKKSDIKK